MIKSETEYLNKQVEMARSQLVLQFEAWYKASYEDDDGALLPALVSACRFHAAPHPPGHCSSTRLHACTCPVCGQYGCEGKERRREAACLNVLSSVRAGTRH